jgi:hypothetical protein
METAEVKLCGIRVKGLLNPPECFLLALILVLFGHSSP